MWTLSSVMELKEASLQRLTLQDREPDLDLVEPARPFRGVVEVHVGMACKPAVVPGLVGVEVVEDDLEPLAGDRPPSPHS